MEIIISAAKIVMVLLLTIILDDYIKNIFVTRHGPRWFWSKTKRVIPKNKQREVYRSFRSDYRQHRSVTTKVSMVIKATITLKDNDDDFTGC